MRNKDGNGKNLKLQFLYTKFSFSAEFSAKQNTVVWDFVKLKTSLSSLSLVLKLISHDEASDSSRKVCKMMSDFCTSQLKWANIFYLCENVYSSIKTQVQDIPSMKCECWLPLSHAPVQPSYLASICPGRYVCASGPKECRI